MKAIDLARMHQLVTSVKAFNGITVLNEISVGFDSGSNVTSVLARSYGTLDPGICTGTGHLDS